MPTYLTAFAHTRLATTVASVVIAVALLAGCSRADEAAAEQPAAEESAAQVAPTASGDGSAIQLDELTQADIEGAALSGELACSFSTGDGAPILFATGIVASDEPAQGVVKISGYVERIAAPGGFNGITDDPTFTGQGKTIGIALTGPASGGGESPPRPADLTYQRADGASSTLSGRWQCGP